jgi:hypothetical protein
MLPVLPVLSFLGLLLTASLAAAQDAPPARPPYLPDPADEDWSFLKTAPKTDVWDPVKYIPLGREDWFMTLSGEIRYRPEGFRVRATEARPATVDTYFLQRYLFGANVQLGRRARFFGELQSGVINGRLGSPRPTDSNTLDMHQAFFEWRQPVRGKEFLSVKAGRQELAIGSTRLISASPGLNVKRSFDAAGLAYRAPSWTAVGAFGALVPVIRGTFNDWPGGGQLFWAVAAGRRSPWLRRGEVGVYYIGIDREGSEYVQGVGPEVRHTAGIKWNGAGPRLDLNYDGILQWGTFAGAPIRGWGFATETGYRLVASGWRPRLSLRADFASGDRDRQDPRLESFNPLFPGNSYSGAVGLFGPTNLTDLTPSFVMAPRSNLTIGFEAPNYWRTSTADGLYATDLRVLVGPAAGTGKYVGTNPGIFAVWQVTRHCQLQGAITRFIAGHFLEETFVSEGFGFYSLSAVYRF